MILICYNCLSYYNQYIIRTFRYQWPSVGAGISLQNGIVRLVLTIFTECHTSHRPSGQGRQKRSPRKCWRGKYLQDRSIPPTCALCPLALQWCEYVSVDTLHCTCSPTKAPPRSLPVSCLLYSLYQNPFFILKCNLLYKGFFKIKLYDGYLVLPLDRP